MEGVFSKELINELDQLSVTKKLAFALLICVRLMPALRKFSLETGYADCLYRDCLDNAKKQLLHPTSELNFCELAELCLAKAPDTENFDHSLTSAALNAVLAITAVINFLVDHNKEHILEVVCMVQDSLALHIQSDKAIAPHTLPLSDIMGDTLMKEERGRQERDINLLKGIRIPLLESRI